jgi:hypothetical protein
MKAERSLTGGLLADDHVTFTHNPSTRTFFLLLQGRVRTFLVVT